jgi:hypothetical protein
MEMETDNIIDDIINDRKLEPTDEELENFKNLVNDWFKYDDQIRKLIIAMKERKNYQRVLNTKIQDFMVKYDYNDLNTQHGCIKSNVKEVKAPIKITEIKDKILKYKELCGEDLLKQIFEEERPILVKKALKRVIPKVSLTL